MGFTIGDIVYCDYDSIQPLSGSCPDDEMIVRTRPCVVQDVSIATIKLWPKHAGDIQLLGRNQWFASPCYVRHYTEKEAEAW